MLNPIAFGRRRPITTLLLVLGLDAGAVLAMKKFNAGVVPSFETTKAQIASWLSSVGGTSKAAEHEEQSHEGRHLIVVTNPKAMDVSIAEPNVCQIHARRRIEIRALVGGYLQEVHVREGQRVRKGDLLFEILPIVYEARLHADQAEAQLAELKLKYSKQLAERSVVSPNEVKLGEAEVAKAQAKVELAKAEVNFTKITAPFDGIVDRLQTFVGSLIEEGEVLTYLNDNSVMWVYFNVPEAEYIRYMSNGQKEKLEDRQIELVLANGHTFPHRGKIAAIGAEFNNETGNIPFRADFPNPEGLLRHGQTGNVLIRETLHNAIVVPQRATFGVLDRYFVWVVDENNVVHQREIVIKHELDDIYVVESGLTVDDKIVLEGVRQVHDGEDVEYEFRKPDEVLANLKFHAE